MSFIKIPIPQAGESLNSLMMRTAEHNGLGGITEVLTSIGVSGGRSDHAFLAAAPEFSSGNGLSA